MNRKEFFSAAGTADLGYSGAGERGGTGVLQ